MIPADVAGTNGIVRDAVERHLLHIEIAIEQKIAVIPNDERQKEYKGNADPIKERPPIIAGSFFRKTQPRHRIT